MKKAFDKVAKHYNGFMKFWKLYRDDSILQILQLKGNEVIADIGGGTGHLASQLSKQAKEVYVIDESPAMLANVEKCSNIKTICSDAFDTKLADNSVDVIVLSDVLHHIKEDDKLMLEVCRILKPNGAAVLHDFDISKLKTKILKLFEMLLFGKLYFRNLNNIKKIFGQFEFEEVRQVTRDNYFIILWRKK